MFQPGLFREQHRRYGHEVLDNSKVLKWGYAFNTYAYFNEDLSVGMWKDRHIMRLVKARCLGSFYAKLSEKEKELWKKEYEDFKHGMMKSNMKF